MATGIILSHTPCSRFILDSCKTPNWFSQLNTMLSKANLKMFLQFDCKQMCKSASDED